jgi:hypothetical protein
MGPDPCELGSIARKKYFGILCRGEIWVTNLFVPIDLVCWIHGLLQIFFMPLVNSDCPKNLGICAKCSIHVNRLVGR